MMRHESPRKPRQCPACGSKLIAPILFGLPMFSEELENKLAAGQIVLGGCCISDDDPKWECVDCHAQVYEKRAILDR